MARRTRDPEGRMALRAHIIELRNRLLIAGVTLLVGSIIGWIIYPNVFDYLVEPLEAASAAEGRPIALNYEKITGAFDLQLRISLLLGVILSSPMWIYQAWAFITPGLTRKERWYAVGFMSAAVPLFLGGIVLAALVVPNAITFLVSFGQDEGTSTLLTANAYLGFIAQTVLAFGFAFLTPVVMTALTMVGLVPAGIWLKGWRVAILLAFVFAALASPTPEPTGMLALAVPIIALYFTAVLLTRLIDKRRSKRAVDEFGGPLDDDEASPLFDKASSLDDAPTPLDDPVLTHSDVT